MNLCLHKQDFGLDAEWIFFATSHGKWPGDRIGGSVKCHDAKRSLPRPMNNQILVYKDMFNVCEEEMSKIKFFGISKETMNDVHKSLRNGFQGETLFQVHKTAFTSYHYHHPKLHTSYQVKTSLMLVLMILIFPQLSNCVISDQWHMTCLYNSFWWVGLVTQVDVEQGDVKVQLMFPHGPHKTFNWPEAEDSCYVPIKNIVCQISSPTKTIGQTYKITDEEYDKTISACQYLNMAK